MTAAYQVLVEDIEAILHTSLPDDLKLRSIEQLIRSVRDEEAVR